MFTLRAIHIGCLIVSLYLIHSSNAGYTSEETDEKSKSLYSAVTSILNSTDTSTHHQKHTFADSQAPCANARNCPTNMPSHVTGRPGVLRNPSSCPGPSGCPIVSPSPNSISVPGHPQSGIQYPPTTGYVSGPQQGGFYGGSYGSNYPPYPSSVPVSGLPPGGYVPGTYGGYVPYQPPSHSAYGYSGYSAPHGSVDGYGSAAPTRSSGSYNSPQPYAQYGQGNGNPGHYGYQGERGYSVLDHSLKTNSEYTEVGTHNGPLQQAPNGYGYGSGYGGYMGMYNRPGF